MPACFANEERLAWSNHHSGGGKGIRTPDLFIANEPLSQLSYTPNKKKFTPAFCDGHAADNQGKFGANLILFAGITTIQIVGEQMQPEMGEQFRLFSDAWIEDQIGKIGDFKLSPWRQALPLDEAVTAAGAMPRHAECLHTPEFDAVQVLATNPHMVLVVDAKTDAVLFVNDAYLSHFGTDSETVKSSPSLHLFDECHPEYRDILASHMASVASGESQELSVQLQSGWCRGGWRWVRATVYLCHSPSGGHLVFNLQDITEEIEHLSQLDEYVVRVHEMSGELETQKQDLEIALHRLRELNHRLSLINITDHLTQVRNRMSYNQCVESEFYLASDDGQPLSLIVLDIDHFKNVNDVEGHIAGDSVLVWAGAMLKSIVKVPESTFRYGGEEFVLVLRIPRGEAITLAERIRYEFEKTPSPVGNITVSIGVATLDDKQYSEPAQLFDAADQALYQAKQRGRNMALHCDEVSTFKAA